MGESLHLNNLPAQISSFVGRHQELEELSELVSQERLVTLTGPGGVGKTRLALQVGERVTSNYAHGAWLVDLAPLADLTLVPKAVALAPRIQEQPGRPLVATLIDRLRPRELLLLMDNCEHLVQTSAELVDLLLRSCPRLSVLATSRELLHVQGERVFRVPSLQLPESNPSSTVDDVRRADAGQLFVQRATSVQPDFSLSDHNAAAVVQVCRQLDGIPLALELAAARLSALTVEHSPIVSKIGSNCSLAAAQRPYRDIGPCMARSNGATTCCQPPSARCYADYRYSPVAGRSKLWKPSVPEANSAPKTSWICSPASLRNHWWWWPVSKRRKDFDTGSSRRCDSTGGPSCAVQGSNPSCADRTWRGASR